MPCNYDKCGCHTIQGQPIHGMFDDELSLFCLFMARYDQYSYEYWRELWVENC